MCFWSPGFKHRLCLSSSIVSAQYLSQDLWTASTDQSVWCCMRGSSDVVFTCPGHCLLLGGVLCPPCVIVMMQRVRSWKRMCVNWKGVRNKKGCRTQQFLMQVKVCPQYPASDWRNYMILSGNLQLKPDRLFQKEQQGPRHDMPLRSTDPAADLCLLITRAFQNALWCRQVAQF